MLFWQKKSCEILLKSITVSVRCFKNIPCGHVHLPLSSLLSFHPLTSPFDVHFYWLCIQHCAVTAEQEKCSSAESCSLGVWGTAHAMMHVHRILISFETISILFGVPPVFICKYIRMYREKLMWINTDIGSRYATNSLMSYGQTHDCRFTRTAWSPRALRSQTVNLKWQFLRRPICTM